LTQASNLTSGRAVLVVYFMNSVLFLPASTAGMTSPSRISVQPGISTGT
jgi:hypothetical protein